MADNNGVVLDMQSALGKFGRVLALRLKPNTDVLLGLTEGCRRAGITNGVIVSAIGSLKDVTFCDIWERDSEAGCAYGAPLKLPGPIELTSASGIICHDDSGEINLHVHISLSDRYGNAYGGHLLEGTKVQVTVDAVIAEIDGVVMGRKYDPVLDFVLFSPKQA